jgi:hypothetical protein
VPGERVCHAVQIAAARSVSIAVRHLKPAIAAVLCAGALSAAFAAPASAGQIVWVRGAASGGGSLWAANDDGTYPHELLAATSSPLSIQLPGATLGDPDVFQAGGATVLFSASASADATACPAACALTFSLTAGALTRQSPASSAMPAGAVYEQQPRLLKGGQMVDRYIVYPSVTAAAVAGASQEGLYVRPLSAANPGTAGTAWADTAAEALPSSADPAPDPANPALIAWVENQDPSCSEYVSNGSPVCQYAILVGGASASPAPAVAIFDDESRGGHGPSSLSWSSNGRTLLIVDDQAPNDGIYTVSASTSKSPASKAVTEVIAEPPGWTFGQARFAGSRIVFDAHGAGHDTPGTSDIYSISASCDSGTCAFPLNATNLTRDAKADNIDPAWTSAAAPLLALGGAPPQAGQAAFDAAAIRSVSANKGVVFEVTLSAAATVVATVSRNGHTIGTTTLHLPAGADTFAIKQIDGHTLTAGHDVGTLSVRGSTAGKRSYRASFTVT